MRHSMDQTSRASVCTVPLLRSLFPLMGLNGIPGFQPSVVSEPHNEALRIVKYVQSLFVREEITHIRFFILHSRVLLSNRIWGETGGIPEASVFVPIPRRLAVSSRGHWDGGYIHRFRRREIMCQILGIGFPSFLGLWRLWLSVGQKQRKWLRSKTAFLDRASVGFVSERGMYLLTS